MHTAHNRHYSPEEIESAKRLDLLTYLQSCEPWELRRVGSEYRTVTNGSLVISNGFWHWKSQNVGGKSALDYLIKVRGMSFPEGLNILIGGPEMPERPYSPPEESKPRPPLKLPDLARVPNKVLSYLQDRGIDYEIIRECLSRKILTQSEKHGSCVFIGRDMSGKEKFACQRGTTGDFKQDLTGSDKRFGFSLSGTGDTLVVCESPVDALSRASLDKMDGTAWRERHYLALGGTSPLALKQYLADHPDIRVVFLCLDNDLAGVQGMIAAQKAIRELPEKSDVKILPLPPPPERGKDWSAYLKSVKIERLAAKKRERGDADGKRFARD